VIPIGIATIPIHFAAIPHRYSDAKTAFSPFPATAFSAFPASEGEFYRARGEKTVFGLRSTVCSVRGSACRPKINR
jgi:hypothetical protein